MPTDVLRYRWLDPSQHRSRSRRVGSPYPPDSVALLPRCIEVRRRVGAVLHRRKRSRTARRRFCLLVRRLRHLVVLSHRGARDSRRSCQDWPRPHRSRRVNLDGDPRMEAFAPMYPGPTQ